MSYDIGMRRPVEDLEANYTYNVAPMFRLAFKNHEGLHILNNQSGSYGATLLDSAIKYFEENKEGLVRLNPKNGWGDYVGALKLLKALRDWGKEFPDYYYSIN